MKPTAAACLCATVISTACVLDIATVVHRTGAASDTAERSNQRHFSDAAGAVSYDFNEGLGGAENMAFFLIATWAFLLLICTVENLDGWEYRRATAAWCVCIYSTVLAIIIIGKCSINKDVKRCSKIYAVQGVGPYGDCSIQAGLDDELNEIWYPRIIGGALISSGLYMISAIAYTFADRTPDHEHAEKTGNDEARLYLLF